MNLTKNFTLSEMTRTDTGLPNSPNEEQGDRLLYVCSFLLQPLRDRFGPLRINSAFRSPEVNRAIQGSRTSQHLLGEAVDFFPLLSDKSDVFDWARHNLVFGQLIDEFRGDSSWIHISLPRIGGVNMQVMKYVDGVYHYIIEA